MRMWKMQYVIHRNVYLPRVDTEDREKNLKETHYQFVTKLQRENLKKKKQNATF